MSKTFSPERLQALRKSAGLSCRVLGERAGIHENTVWLAETGKRLPGADTLAKLCDALDCSPDDLFSVDDSPPLTPDQEAG